MRKIDIKNFFNKQAKERDRLFEKNKIYHKEIEKLFDFLIDKEESVLEIGCGTGNDLANIKSPRKVGIDFSEEMIEIASKKFKDVEFITADAENYKIEEKFRTIILKDTINVLEDVQKVFEHVNKKSCDQDTRLILTFHNHLWEPFLKLAEKINLKMKMPLENWLSCDDAENLLRLSDFEVIKKGQRVLIPVYIPIITAFFNKYLSQLPLIKKLCFFNYIIARPINKNQNKNLSCSIIIPARNEEGNIERALKELPRFCKDIEIIFVEGGSKDDTYNEIKRVAEKYKKIWNIKYMKQKRRGKGDAVRKGFDAAKGDVLMILDADLTVPPKDLPKFYRAITRNKGEFINGTRLVYPMEEEAMRTLNKIGNKFFSLLFTWILGQRFKDTLCGTKVIKKKDYEKLKRNRKYFGDFDPFGDFDLIFGASKINLKIVEVPVRYRERTYGNTNISRFKHGWLLLKMSFFAMRRIKFV